MTAQAAKTWNPLQHEADLFCNIYVDESSQTKHRYLVLGGLLVSHSSHATAFETDIAAARDHTIPTTKQDGRPKVIKWEKASAYNLEGYKKVIDAYFSFPQRHKLPARKNVRH